MNGRHGEKNLRCSTQLGGLILRLLSSVPEADNVDGIFLDEIHQFVQPIDYKLR